MTLLHENWECIVGVICALRAFIAAAVHIVGSSNSCWSGLAPSSSNPSEDATKVQVGLSPNEYTHTVSPQCFGGERSLTRCLAGVRLTCACGAAVRTASSHLVHLRHPIIPVHALFSRSVKSLYISELVRSWFGGTCFRTRSVCATLTSRNCPPRID